MKNLPTAVTFVAVVSLSAPDATSAQLTLPEVIVTAPRESGALTVPFTEQSTADIRRTPGGVEVVSDTAFKVGPAQTIRDVLGWVPGILMQPRWGPDARVSIRGSGLSRSYGNRGLNVYMDGIPINTSDGLFDLFEIDPTAFRHVEVFKGANALRYGANALGGAINLVTPSGRDASPFDGRIDGGSFGYLKGQASTAAADGPYDHFITASAERFDGFREHSNGHQERVSGNLGYRFSPDAETRFYLNANSWRSRLPGEVSKESALNSPRAADPEFIRLDQQRNIDSLRIANKTTLRFGSTLLDFGVFGVRRHVMHPIYQWLDYRVHDHGGFIRATDDRFIGGFRNRMAAGVNLHNGSIDNNQYINETGAVKGEMAASNIDKSKNFSAYAQDSFFLRPDVALVAGAQYQHAARERQDRFPADGNQSGRRTYDNFSPKVGVVWDVDPAWQVFGNLSRSAEVPTFDTNTFATSASSSVDAQTATTLEAGTRGWRPTIRWDIAIYRSEIRNELQCLTTGPFSSCDVVNAGRTVHQGVEAGVEIAILDAVLAKGDRIWFNASYTYNDFFFDGDPLYGDNRLPGVPPHYLRAEMLYRHPGGFYAGPNIEWMPDAFFADNANRLAVDAYSLWNFRIGYAQRSAGWSGYVEGRNLLNRRYISSAVVAGTANASSALFNPGTGRALYAGVRLTW
jgi:iron complex outermembrane receptor protein